MDLQPGHKFTASVSLQYYFDAGRPPPGRYSVYVVYYAQTKALIDGSATELITPRFEFTVSE